MMTDPRLSSMPTTMSKNPESSTGTELSRTSSPACRFSTVTTPYPTLKPGPSNLEQKRQPFGLASPPR
ncbi:hypothetical protein BKA80DRAFT_280180 [Phyllosticta citrichinensis]